MKRMDNEANKKTKKRMSTTGESTLFELSNKTRLGEGLGMTLILYIFNSTAGRSGGACVY